MQNFLFKTEILDLQPMTLFAYQIVRNVLCSKPILPPVPLGVLYKWLQEAAFHAMHMGLYKYSYNYEGCIFQTSPQMEKCRKHSTGKVTHPRNPNFLSSNSFTISV